MGLLFIREEFKKHKGASDEHAKMFIEEWTVRTYILCRKFNSLQLGTFLMVYGTSQGKFEVFCIALEIMQLFIQKLSMHFNFIAGICSKLRRGPGHLWR